MGGGNSPYQYDWSNGDTTQDLNGLSGGNYILIITDSSGCTVNLGPLTVNEPTSITLDTAVLQNVSCNGAADGQITLTILGGTLPYAYLWSNSATTRDLIGINGGTYTVTITDANACTLDSLSFVITEPTILAINLDSLNDITCNGAANGAIYTNSTGGTSPYTYLWSSGATTASIDSLNAGTYDLTVTDANNCTVALTGTIINEPALLTIALDSLGFEVCANNSNDGFIDVQALGGTGPYTYVWTDTAQNSRLFVGDSFPTASAGLYRVIVTDANACITFNDYNLSALSDIQVNLDSTATATCATNTDGAIYISTSSGVGSYTYNWNNGTTNQDLLNVAVGAYSITVTDSLGCQVIKTYSVTNPRLVNITIDSTNDVLCNGDQTGNIYASTTGNSFFHVYDWNNGAATLDLLNISGGIYILTVTDVRDSCEYVSDTVFIEQPDSLSSTVVSLTPETCAGSSADGAITVNITGGVMPYRYEWLFYNVTSNTLTNASAGQATLLTVDANNCFIFQNVTIPAISDITINLDSIRRASCIYSRDGHLTVSATGGIGDYSYSWSNGVNTPVNDSLGGYWQYPLTYTVAVTDSLGCTVSEDFYIGSPDSLKAALLSITLPVIVLITVKSVFLPLAEMALINIGGPMEIVRDLLQG